MGSRPQTARAYLQSVLYQVHLSLLMVAPVVTMKSLVQWYQNLNWIWKVHACMHACIRTWL